MNTLSLSTLVLLFIVCSSYAQNTFPANGNVGIGTTAPASALDVNGAISLKGLNISESKSIPVVSDGTYILASGNRIKGTYTLSFEAANRVQTVVLLVNATHYDYNSTISVLSNVSYAGAIVMSNFKLIYNSDNTAVYLLFDIGNRNGGTAVTALFNGTGAYLPSWGGTMPSSPNAGGVYSLVINQGNVGINTTDTKGYKLAVNGSAIATSMTVKLNSAWPDNVFKPTYKLPSLEMVKAYIDKNHHLSEIPSEAEVLKDGQNLGEMNKLLLKKVEELTLYLLKLKDTIQDQSDRLKALENKR